MHVEAQGRTVVLKVEDTFATPDMEVVFQILGPFAPFSDLIVDFSDAYEFPDSSFPSLFKVIEQLAGVRVALRGLTAHQSRLLKYLGLLR